MKKNEKMKKSLLIKMILLFVILFSNITVHADIGSAFLDIGYGARPTGMGGAYTAISNDAHSIFWNPAGLTLIQNSQLTMMHTKQFGLVPYGLGAYVTNIGANYMGLAFLTSGDDVLKENSFYGSYARALNLPFLGKTRIGANLKLRTSSFGNNKDGGENRSQGTASGYGIDLGFLWSLDKSTNFGIFARDIINNVSYDNTTTDKKYDEIVPPGLIFGLSRQFGKSFLLGFDWEKSLHSDTVEKFHIGGELSLLEMLYFRGGMWQNVDTYLNRNYSVGLGLKINKHRFGGQIDFSYVMNDLANTPRFSLSIYH